MASFFSSNFGGGPSWQNLGSGLAVCRVPDADCEWGKEKRLGDGHGRK